MGKEDIESSGRRPNTGASDAPGHKAKATQSVVLLSREKNVYSYFLPKNGGQLKQSIEKNFPRKILRRWAGR